MTGAVKRASMICIIIIAVLLLAGCSSKVADEDIWKQYANEDAMFVTVWRGEVGNVIVNKKTNVMYWLSTGAYNAGSLTPLFNPDGTLQVWDEASHYDFGEDVDDI